MCTPGTATCAAVPLWPSPHPNACPNVLPVSTRRVPRYFFDRYHPQCLTNTFPLHLCSPGIPTVLVMTFALGKDDPSIALLLVILGVSLTSTGPIQPFIATLFMGQSLTDEDKGFYSGMLRSTQALGKALGSAIVGAAIGGPWIESWKRHWTTAATFVPPPRTRIIGWCRCVGTCFRWCCPTPASCWANPAAWRATNVVGKAKTPGKDKICTSTAAAPVVWSSTKPGTKKRKPSNLWKPNVVRRPTPAVRVRRKAIDLLCGGSF